MPRSIYKKVRNSALPIDLNPILVDAQTKKSVQTSRQYTRYLLCDDCEGLFSAKGEDIVIPDLFDADGFDLVEKRLKGTEHINALNNHAEHGVDINAYAYFSLSIFWRGSVHKWGIKNQRMYKRLAEYEELIRCYLLDTASSFPKNLYMTVLVNKDLDSPVGMSFPQNTDVLSFGDEIIHFGFCVPGVWFDLAIGENMDNNIHSNFSGLEVPLSMHHISFEKTRIYEMAHKAVAQSERVN